MKEPDRHQNGSAKAATPTSQGLDRSDAPAAFGTGLLALDVIFSADATRAPLFAAGGTCGNVLAALSYLGWQAFPVARMNGDAASRMVRADLTRWDVSLDFAALKPGVETPIVVQRNKWLRDGSPSHRFSLTCPTCGSWFPSFRPVTSNAAEEVAEAISGAAPSGFAPRVFFFDRVSRGALVLAKALAEQGAVIVFEPTGISDPGLFSEACTVAHILKYSHQRLPQLASGARLRHNVLLEIETLGGKGLRFRSRVSASGKWQALAAVIAPRLLDTAGAGDWCTAGLLSVLAGKGAASLESARQADIEGALRFGQAAAALACGYEGARGVMNAFDPTAFLKAVSTLLRGSQTLEANPPPATNKPDSRHLDSGSRVPRANEVRTICAVCP
jgi:pfkB family carbohydrate kinase